MKKITAKFFLTDAGNQPVRDWLRGLDKSDSKIIGEDIATVELGWPIGMPVCRKVGNKGIKEVRSSIRNGKVEARVYFGIDGGTMVLLYYSDGKSDQQNDIKVAEKHWSTYKLRKKGKSHEQRNQS